MCPDKKENDKSCCKKGIGIVPCMLAGLMSGIAIGVIFALLVHYLIFPALEKWFRRMREKKKA